MKLLMGKFSRDRPSATIVIGSRAVRCLRDVTQMPFAKSRELQQGRNCKLFL